jgi:hypothetical protein
MTSHADLDDSGWFTLDGERVWGQVALRSGRRPEAMLALDMDGPWSRPGGYPQQRHMDLLVGRLMTNETVVFGEVQVVEWFPGRLLATAAWALTGVGVDGVFRQCWGGVHLTCAGLDWMLAAPFTSQHFPMDTTAGPQRYVVEAQPVVMRDMADGVWVTARQDVNVRRSTPWQFAMEATPAVLLEAIDPLPVRDWIERWIDPLSAVLLLLTGIPEHIGPVTLYEEWPSKDQVARTAAKLWGPGVYQEPSSPEDAVRRSREPLARLGDGPSLAQMVALWRDGPLPQSIPELFRAGLSADLPITPRFLALVQGLESLDGHLHRTDEQAADATYGEKRRVAREAVGQLADEVLDPGHRRFIRKAIPTRSTVSLAERLRRSVREVAAEDLIAEWNHQLGGLREEVRQPRTRPDLSEVLAATRNRLAHGARVNSENVASALPVLELILRGQLLRQLGFSDAQVSLALGRVNRG